MDVDWRALFELGVSPLELVVRGTAVYWFLFLVFRMVLRRDVGAIGVADVLLVVLIADAAQNAMAGEYRSITDGAVLVSTIIGWNLLIDWLAYRFAPLRRILEPRPLPLVRDGRILRANLRRELMSVEDLLAKLREHGVDDVAEVRTANLESDGEMSAVTRGGAARGARPRRRGPRAAA
jgi:uncharacterized membrane protein YcaP (DUF421 family)